MQLHPARNTGTLFQAWWAFTFAWLPVFSYDEESVFVELISVQSFPFYWSLTLLVLSAILASGALIPCVRLRQIGLIFISVFWAATLLSFHSLIGDSFALTIIILANLLIMSLITYVVDVWRKPRCQQIKKGVV